MIPVDDANPVNSCQTQFDIEALSGFVEMMWKLARDRSESYQDVLAILENGVIAADRNHSVTCEQLAAFRGALDCLEKPNLEQGAVEALHTEFLRAGFSQLVIVEAR